MGRFPVPLITALVLLASWAAFSSRVVTTLNYEAVLRPIRCSGGCSPWESINRRARCSTERKTTAAV
jgi:hypothetical protein